MLKFDMDFKDKSVQRQLAEYRDVITEEYKNCACIAALPSESEIAHKLKRLGYIPEFNDLEKKEDSFSRRSKLGKLQVFNVPISQYIWLSYEIDSAIRMGYAKRNSLSRKSNTVLMKKLKREMDGASVEEDVNILCSGGTCSSMITVLGASGVGKTMAVENLLRLYGQVYYHSVFQCEAIENDVQIVWIKVDAPYDGSPKTLCRNFFSEIDRLLEDPNISYYDKYANPTKSEDSLLQGLAYVCQLLQVGILVIDEIQLLTLDLKSSKKVLEFFTQISNRLRTPILLIGNREAETLLNNNLRTGRRISSGGYLDWKPMAFDSRDWNKIVREKLWNMQILREAPVEIPDDVNYALYDESQGILGILVNLFSFSQCNALMLKQEFLTESNVRDAMLDFLPRIKSILDRYKDGDLNAISEIGVLDEDIVKGQEIASQRVENELRKLEIDLSNKNRQSELKENVAKTISEKIVNTLTELKGHSYNDIFTFVLQSLDHSSQYTDDEIFTNTILWLQGLKVKENFGKQNKQIPDTVKMSIGSIMTLPLDSTVGFAEECKKAGLRASDDEWI